MGKLIIGPQRKRGDDGYHTFSVRIKEETVEKLDRIAKETGRTRNNLIGLLLEYAVDNCVIEKNEEP
ncbi:ribbon-helix-helix protein, CopG family [Oscillibacter sp.]|uniref:ribbon-helix-helix protein, CopG family n=1 Tax=Oscillibacter sp. TaxID=1945593 RepID=UPI001B6D055D|nr:ribbon-helix-helix protein, CopG family [Oscillibacter sp.]MBP3508922.1 CopG family transcriptional regulator [Oscillibacter sp.]